MNDRIEVYFTRRDGYRDHDTFGITKQAIEYARLLHRVGYHIDCVIDAYRNQELKWQANQPQKPVR